MQFFDKRFFLILLFFGWMQHLPAADENKDKCPLPSDKKACSFPIATDDDVDTITQEVAQCAKALQKQFSKLKTEGTGQKKFEKWSACTNKLIKANQELDIAFDEALDVEKRLHADDNATKAIEVDKAQQLTEAQRQISKTLDEAYSQARPWFIADTTYKTALCRSALASLLQLTFDIDKDMCEQQTPVSCTAAEEQCGDMEDGDGHIPGTPAYCNCVKYRGGPGCCESVCGVGNC